MLKSGEKELSLFKIWLVFFSYTVLVSLLVKCIILPYIIPSFYAGNGLAVGGDWIYFNELALELAKKIKDVGWSAWQLRPGVIGQAPAGIAAAIYAFTVPNSLTLVPLNSALHATAALALLMIIKIFIPDTRKAIYAVLPFLLFPSAMLWYTQLHKDSYSCAGVLLFLYAWLSLTNIDLWKRFDRGLIFRIAIMILGAFLVWIVRPYEVRMMQGIAACFAFILTILFVIRASRKKLSWFKAFLAVLLFWLLVVIISPFTRESGNLKDNIHRQVNLPDEIVTESKLEEVFVPSNISRAEISRSEISQSEISRRDISRTELEAGKNPIIKTAPVIKKRNKIIVMIKTTLDSIAVVRVGSTSTYGKTSIDTNVNFKNNRELIYYIPRALQVVFLSPFPSQWFSSGTLPINTLMRRVSFFEMIIIYLGLLMFSFSLWHWRRKAELWMALFFCTFMLLIYGLCIANVGTIYRIRYPFIMAILALGIAGLTEIRKFLKQNNK